MLVHLLQQRIFRPVVPVVCFFFRVGLRIRYSMRTRYRTSACLFISFLGNATYCCSGGTQGVLLART